MRYSWSQQTSRATQRQGPSLQKTLEDKLYCLRFDDVTMFTQP